MAAERGAPQQPATEQSSAESGGPAARAEPQAIFVQLLGAVAAGIGVLGFVTFFGGAILWIRFDQAELPANEAVAVVPREVLLTTGASFLVPALMLSVAAAVAVVFMRTAFHRSPVVALLLVLLLIEIWAAPDAVWVSALRAIKLVAFGVITLAICWLVLRSTGSVLWFGVALFGAVSAFTIATTYFRTTDRPKVEPVALLRKDEGPRTGFFVARTSDHIYLGRGWRTTRTPGGSRLVAIPTADITDVSIGPLISPELIRRRAARLALGLCRTAGGEPGRDRAEAEQPPAVCSDAQILGLRKQARR